MNVSQYNQRFTQLSRYAGGLVKNEVEKTKRFVKGLKLEIRSKLVLYNREYIFPCCRKSPRSRHEYIRRSRKLGEGLICVKTPTILESIR